MCSLPKQTDIVSSTSSRRRVTDIQFQVGVLCLKILRGHAFKADIDVSSLNILKFLLWLMSASEEALFQIRQSLDKNVEKHSCHSVFTSNFS